MQSNAQVNVTLYNPTLGMSSLNLAVMWPIKYRTCYVDTTSHVFGCLTERRRMRVGHSDDSSEKNLRWFSLHLVAQLA